MRTKIPAQLKSNEHKKLNKFLFFILFLFISLTATFSIGIDTAHAHAKLDDSNPKPNEVLTKSPENILLTFSQEIKTTENSITLFDEKGETIKLDGKVKSPLSNQASIELPELGSGGYVVTYTVVSADSHTISGTFSFYVSIEDKKVDTIDPSIFKKITLANDENAYQGIATFFRWLTFISVAIVIAVSVLFTTATLNAELRTIRKLLAIFIAAFSLSTLFSIFIQNANLDNKSLLNSISFASFTDQLEFNFGLFGLIRIVAGLLILASCYKKQIFTSVAPALAILLAATLTFSGHSSVGEYTKLAIPSSIIHVLVTSVWFGGLFLLVLSNKVKKLELNISSFSKIALICVATTVLTGIFASWRQVGSFENARNSEFGDSLTFKVLIVAITIVVAFFTRQYLKKDRKLAVRKLVIAEVILLLVAFAATSVLVSQVPSRQSAETPYTQKSVTADGVLDITLDPAKSGNTELHVYTYDLNGLPLQVENASLTDPPIVVQISSLSNDDKPIVASMRFQGLNHFISAGLEIPYPGDWTIEVKVKINDEIELSDKFQVEIR